MIQQTREDRAKSLLSKKYELASGKKCDEAILQHLNYCVKAMMDFSDLENKNITLQSHDKLFESIERSKEAQSVLIKEYEIKLNNLKISAEKECKLKIKEARDESSEARRQNNYLIQQNRMQSETIDKLKTQI